MGLDGNATGHLDAEAFRALLEMVGDDPEFVGELVDTYLADSPVQLAEMAAAIDAGAAAELLRPAHTLKGNSANLGAVALAAICRELETQARAGTLDGADERLASAKAEYAAVVDALADARSREWRIE